MDIEKLILELQKEITTLKKDVKDLKEELRIESCRRMGKNPYEESKPYDLSSIKRSKKIYK